MNERLPVPLETRLAQGKASDPAVSAWVSANAGSGKTFVLTRRVIRLLLAGAKPSQILCLTFTKAAAAEMANRVFKTLGQWVAVRREQLEGELADMLGRPPTIRELERAPTLFALSLDSPGGLKIQTIHAFCEALLHQFPLEANVSGHFKVIEDSQQDALIIEARRQEMLALESEADAGNTGAKAAFDELLRLASDDAIEKGLDNLIARREPFLAWANGDVAASMEPLWHHCGFVPGEGEEAVLRAELAKSLFTDAELLALAARGEIVGGTTNGKSAALLRRFVQSSATAQRFALRSQIYLTGKLEAKKPTSIFTKAITDARPGLLDRLEQEIEKTLAALNRRAALRLLKGSQALFTLGGAILQRYMRLKKQRGLADFNDLVSAAGNLLTRADVRQWVQYKLDKGIDHVLVDEAQDTSPQQWAIINALVEEFHAGAGTSTRLRTVFAVGDEKQSIYSFQGADPRKFALEQAALERRVLQSGLAFERIELHLSFRSTPDVLVAVDRVFSIAENARGLGESENGTVHEAIRRNDPGEVLVWPLISTAKSPEPTDWLAPLDEHGEDHAAEQLAARIAGTIHRWVQQGEILPGSKRPIVCGDILILVKRRDVFSSAVIRQLKERDLLIAGADRLKLTEHIAIEDLLALGRVMLMREDDLSLAAILKSPLFSISEDKLTALASQRDGGTLFEHLVLLAENGDSPLNRLAAGIHAKLERWRTGSQNLSAYAFYASILGAEGGRRQFLSRLGTEAEDVLDAFEQAAINHGAQGGMGLEDFIAGLTRASPEIKREVDMRENEIRVITVHSAKGLEAPIVFLVDPCSPAFNKQHLPKVAQIVQPDGNAGFLWANGNRKAIDLIAAHDAQFAESSEEEYRRLLYVGMTRAADRLIICGWHKNRSPQPPHWHSMVSAALAADWQELTGEDGLKTFRWTQPATGEGVARNGTDRASGLTPAEAPPTQAAPSWLFAKAKREAPTPRPLTPSTAAQMLAGQAGPGLSADGTLASPEMRQLALLRGTLTHKLLQHLPQVAPERRAQAAADYVMRQAADRPLAERERIAGEALALLERPELSFLFGPNSRAEVAIAGHVRIGGRDILVSGQIDRLAIDTGQVAIADFKTNRNASASAISGYALQMALYRALLMQIHPGRAVDCQLIWTRDAALTRFDSAEMDAALAALKLD